MTVNRMIEFHKEFMEAYKNTGLISIAENGVHLDDTYFLDLFGNWEYEINQQTTNDFYERSLNIAGTTFFCLTNEERLNEAERKRLGIEDNF